MTDGIGIEQCINSAYMDSVWKVTSQQKGTGKEGIEKKNHVYFMPRQIWRLDKILIQLLG